ncbi:MAG: LAGLIDADG family homing endonuclease, partial [Patescibacteria group bacterium]|nr:LAGLIDADG family homing endonuclease [Patescibacteria group bacterium]
MNLFKKTKKEETKSPPISGKPVDTIDLIAPAGVKINSNYLQIGEKYARTIFVFSFPQTLATSWLSPLITLDQEMNIALFLYPKDTNVVLKHLTKKSAQVQSQMSLQQEKGHVRSPKLEAATQNIENLRDKLQQGAERLFGFGLYITVFSKSPKELDEIENKVRAILENQMVYAKPAVFQQEQGFISTLPLKEDKLLIQNNFNTSPLSSAFPFVSSDLSDSKGILYGINRHNNSLILFDRFSLENANMVVFAKSGSGKSVCGSEPTLIKTKKEVKLEKIGPFIEKLIKRKGCLRIDKELEGVIDPGISVYTFDKKLKGKWSPVSVAARKKAPKKLYKFTTASGREITTTGDHNMLILRNGKVVAVKSEEVRKGEYAPVPRAIPEPEKIPKELNLLKLMRNAPRVYVHGATSLIKQNYRALKKTRLDPKLDKYLYKYCGDTRIPIQYFWKILNHLQIKPNRLLLKKLSITSCRNKDKKQFYLPAIFPINYAFLRILGYIVSEGAVQNDIVLVSNIDSEVISDIEKSLNEMKIGYHYHPTSIALGSRSFVEMIKAIGLNGKSAHKKVPSFVFSQSNKKAAEFLKAYFEGDGGVESASVNACSKSQQLISELSYLLLRYGIIARIKPKKKTAVNSGTSGIYWHLTISGQADLRRYAQKIGFVSKKKQKKLLGIINEKHNTNVDVIPTADSLIEEIYQLFKPAHQYFQLSGISSVAPLRRKTFKPSPKFLKKTVETIEERIENLKNLGSQIMSFDAMPSLASVIEKGRNDRRLNSLLWQELGQSWRLIKNKEVNPSCQNVFKTIKVINGDEYNLPQIKNTIWSSFKSFGLSMKDYHPCIREFLISPSSFGSYNTLKNVSDFVNKQYQQLSRQLEIVEEKLATLKILINSDLFWDPINKIEKIKNKDKYVYDLTVDNEVFLAGQGGLFVHNSYAVKLEVLRSLMQETEVIIIDPEKEYKYLTETIDGTYIDISLTSNSYLNPFDLPVPGPDEKPVNVLRNNIVNLVGLIRMMLGGLTPEEDSIVDKALTETYAARDITPQSDFSNINPPLMRDFQTILKGMVGAESLVTRLEKYVTGSYSGFFNQPTNVELNNQLVVFSIRDMEEELRPLAMYVILRYIWNIIRSKRRKRMLVVDEAWVMMQHEDAGSFLFGIAKRCRKYYLGLTTITQDVSDFMKSKYGKPIVTNSSLQLLLKQSPASMEIIQKTFNLTDREKYLLLESAVGEGIFFAGNKHVAI